MDAALMRRSLEVPPIGRADEPERHRLRQIIGEHVKCASESDMPVKLENVQITSYQIGVLDNNASTDVFVFPPQGSLPDTDGRDFLLWRKHYGTADIDSIGSTDSPDPYGGDVGMIRPGNYQSAPVGNPTSAPGEPFADGIVRTIQHVCDFIA
jgi:hypothetical protein